jgi:FAD/FMN-containing dehydrogenase
VRTASEVRYAVAFARRQAVPLSIRSDRHALSGRSTNDGGIVIDLSAMNAIDVRDPAARRVRIEPGAIFAEVAAVLARHGWALSSTLPKPGSFSSFTK